MSAKVSKHVYFNRKVIRKAIYKFRVKQEITLTGEKKLKI